MFFRPVMVMSPNTACGPVLAIKLHVQRVVRRLQRCRRHVHRGERIAVLADRREQASLRRQHVLGERRLAGFQPELGARVRRHRPLDIDVAQTELRPEVEPHRDRHGRLVRRMIDRIGQARIVQGLAGDRQHDLRLVVAVAVQRSGEAAEVLARALGQREASDR